MKPFFWQVASLSAARVETIEVFDTMEDLLNLATGYGGWWEGEPNDSASWVEHDGKVVATMIEGPDRLLTIVFDSGEIKRYPMPIEYR